MEKYYFRKVVIFCSNIPFCEFSKIDKEPNLELVFQVGL